MKLKTRFVTPRDHAVSRSITGFFLLVLCTAAAGCQKAQVESYTVPAERKGAAAQTQLPAGHPDVGTSAGQPAGAPAWTLPAGWTELPGSGMRFATIVVEQGEKPLEIRVTPLSLMAKDPLENVNRWRGQIGLNPIGQDELGSVMTSIVVDGHPTEIVNMKGPAVDGAPPQQVLAAIMTGESQVWFFLLMEEASRVSRHAADFEAFVRGVRFPASAAGDMAAATGSDMSGSGMTMPPAAGGETMIWKAPAGWVQDAEASGPRVATFHLADPAGEVAITRFPGDVGGLLANINRWRNQLGLSPVSDPAEQPSEAIQVAGTAARLFDLSGAGKESDRQRMYVVFLTRSDMSWFIKMTGPHALLGANEKAFREFLGTIQLESGGR